jgi:hypothetical protein
MEEIKQKVKDLRQRFSALVKKLDLPGKKEKVVTLEGESVSEGFWKNQEEAQQKMRELAF